MMHILYAVIIVWLTAWAGVTHSRIERLEEQQARLQCRVNLGELYVEFCNTWRDRTR